MLLLAKSSTLQAQTDNKNQLTTDGTDHTDKNPGLIFFVFRHRGNS